jgi:predicted flap endonuclease-1-like 5' DNA nuclease
MRFDCAPLRSARESSQGKDINMRAIRVFILGVFFGVYLKWIIDEIYTRDNLRMIAKENMRLRDRLQHMEGAQSLERKSVQPARPTPQPDQRPVPTATPKPARRASTSTRDDLKKIKGIGPVMEKKLNAAGVTTYEQFARLTTQQLQNILGISKRVQQSADNLISQAKKLVQEKSKR